MRILIITDIHGCYDEFMELLNKANYDKYQDRLIILGDLVDRGPKTLEVLDYCMENKHNIEVLIGNHDRMLLDAIKSLKINNVKKINPASSIGLLVSRGKEYVEKVYGYINSLKYYKLLSEYNIILVHGGMFNKRSIEDQDKLDMILARPIDVGFNEIEGYNFIVGHTPTIAIIQGHDKIIERGNTLFLDCGCVHGGSLCCYSVEDKITYYVKGKDYA